MRVLHCDSERTWRGGQNQVALLIYGLREKGIKQFLAAKENSAIAHKLDKELEILYLDYKSISLFQDASKLKKFCADRYIDVVDAHSSKAHFVALLAKFMGAKFKLIVHRRVDFIPTSIPILNWKYRSKLVDSFVSISDFIAKVMADSGVAKNRIRVVKSCASFKQPKFTSREQARQSCISRIANLDPNKVWILYASALSDQKDPLTFVKALAALRDSKIEYQCILAGEGELYKPIQNAITQLKLQDHVQMIGFRSDIDDWMQASDILCMSSKYEGLGTVVLDATLSGCCVVSTNAGGIPEMIHHERTGLLANVGDAIGLANQLKKAVLSADLRKELNDNAMVMVRTHHSLNAMVDGNLKVYLESA